MTQWKQLLPLLFEVVVAGESAEEEEVVVGLKVGRKGFVEEYGTRQAGSSLEYPDEQKPLLLVVEELMLLATEAGEGWCEEDDTENDVDEQAEDEAEVVLLGRVAYTLIDLDFEGLVVVVAADDDAGDVLSDDEEGDIIAGVYVDVVKLPPQYLKSLKTDLASTVGAVPVSKRDTFTPPIVVLRIDVGDLDNEFVIPDVVEVSSEDDLYDEL